MITYSQLYLCSVHLNNTDVYHDHRVSSPIYESLLETCTTSTSLQVMSLASRAPQIDVLRVRYDYQGDKTAAPLSRVKQQVSTFSVSSSSGKQVSSMLSGYQTRYYVPSSRDKSSFMNSLSTTKYFLEDNKKLTRR